MLLKIAQEDHRKKILRIFSREQRILQVFPRDTIKRARVLSNLHIAYEMKKREREKDNVAHRTKQFNHKILQKYRIFK